MSNLHSILMDAFPAGSLVLDPGALAPLARDRKTAGDPPAAALLAGNTSEVALLLTLANKHRFAVFPRGGATNSTGACVPLRGGVVLDLTRMNRILEISTEDMLAVAEPGVITAHLAREAARHGLLYGPDPAGAEESTLGGNVATGAGGPSCLKYGVTREWLLGLEVVLPTGEIIQSGARTAKCAAGFDLTRLMCGSAGMLGVVTRITAKLLPLPAARRSILAGFANVEAALHGARRLFASGTLPCALEFLDGASLALLKSEPGYDALQGCGAVLLSSVDGDEAGVSSQLATIRAAFLGAAARMTEPSSPSEEAGWWQGRNRLSPLLATIAVGKINEDICVPRSTLAQFLTLAYQAGKKDDIPVVVFGHLGDGNLHVNLMFDPADQRRVEAAGSIRETLLEAVLRLNGTITGEHGVGLAKRDWFAREAGEASLRAQMALKSALDPNNILNPGKVFRDASPLPRLD